MYYTLVKDNNDKNNEISKGELYEKKSKFFSYIYNIKDEEDAKKYIEDIKNKNKDARHCVYIYSYLKDGKINIRFCDDGETQGTGTKAIYELMTKENITNICIVIVRYFGGILLGAGPLSRAYLNCARNAINLCRKEIIYKYINYADFVSYNKFQKIKNIIDNYMNESKIKINYINYNEKVEYNIEIREDIYEKVLSLIK